MDTGRAAWRFIQIALLLCHRPSFALSTCLLLAALRGQDCEMNVFFISMLRVVFCVVIYLFAVAKDEQEYAKFVLYF